MKALARRNTSGAGRRQTVVAAASLSVIALFVLVTAMPAFAHHPILSGKAVCSDGDHVITWSIGNSESDRTMHIETATAAIGAQSYPVTGYAIDVPPSGTTTATTIVPGGVTGTVTLTVHATWADAVQSTQSTSVTLTYGCSPSTTTTTCSTSTTSTTASTTTTTEAPTTTTTAEETTTTTAEETTTTTIGEETTTTIGETTTTIGGETTTSIGGATTTTTGTPVVTEGTTGPSTSTPTTASRVTTASTPPGPLPFTGGSSDGPIFGLVSLAAGALALTLAGRRKKYRDS